MRLGWLPLALALAPSMLGAQDTTLRVLRHTPADTASADNLVTVTFDRPVAGRLDAGVPAARIFRVAPAIAGEVAWRDPVTIRFIPAQPIAPGTSLSVTIDTAFRALDGSRLPRPYRFSFRVPGPRLLARSFGDAPYQMDEAQLRVDGRVVLLYSAPVDPVLIGRIRLDLTGCGADSIVPYRLVQQRRIAPNDPWFVRNAGGWGRDTVGDRFRRVVELVPARGIPAGCKGRMVVPNTTDDAQHGREERFSVATAPRFRIAALRCMGQVTCATEDLVIAFSAGVRRADVERYVRLQPGGAVRLAETGAVAGPQWLIRTPLRPRTTYTVNVDTALRDVDGRRLEGPASARIAIGDFAPAVRYPRPALVVARSGSRTVPVRHVNVRSVRLTTFAVPERYRVRALAMPPWELARQLSSVAERPETVTVAVPAPLNVATTSEVALPARVVRAPGQLFVLRIDPAASTSAGDSALRSLAMDGTQPSFGSDVPYSLVQLTDLAVHARVGTAEGTVIVTALADGRPRGGAAVVQLDETGRVVARGRTDESGVARLEAPLRVSEDIRGGRPSRAAASTGGAIEASLGDDRVAMPVESRYAFFINGDPLDPERLGARRGEMPAAAAAVFAERGIYRPGETVHLKGVVRQGMLGALTTPVGAPVRLTVTYQPNAWPDEDEDVVVRDTTLATSEFGTVADSVTLRPGAALGTYVAALHVRAGEEWAEVARDSVRVAEYRAPQFLVETRTDSGPRYGGDTLRVSVAARYLFGAPMGRTTAAWRASFSALPPWAISIPGAEGWVVGDWDWSRDRAAALPELPPIGGSVTLDSTGRAALKVPLAQLRSSRPGRVHVAVAVTDLDRQVVTSTADASVHPARLYILARRQSRGWYWRVGESSATELRTVTPEGRDVGGVPVVVSLVRRAWRGRGDDWSDSTLRVDTVRTGLRPAAYAFTPALGGMYELRLTADDGHGGTARTTLSGYAFAGSGTWWARSPYHLPLVVARRDARVGDDVEVAFESPFDEADAWVTIERERTIERRTIAVRRGPNAFALHVAPSYVPNVFVSVLLLRRGAGPQRSDSASEPLRLGYAELGVGSDVKRLTVSVAPAAAEYRPGDSATVRVRVSDRAGRGVPSEVALWAVDEGVLALTGYATPDVLARLYDPRPLDPRYWSSLTTALATSALLRMRGASSAYMGERMQLSEVVVTGVGAEPTDAAQPSMRSTFRSTAFYVAGARTGADGAAVIRARVPDNLTTFRVMAVAIAADDRFGQGDTTLLVSRALVARPSLPRFVRAGDSLVAGAVVNARDGAARDVTVEAATDGIVLQGAARRGVTLAPGKGAEARFAFGVPPRDRAPDTVVVRLRASDGTAGDAVETRLPVRPDFHPRTHTRLGAVWDEADATIDLPPDIDPARSRVSVRVGTTPVAAMLAAYRWLRAYPYDCTEQIASGGRAILAVWRTLGDGARTRLQSDPRAQLQLLADELARRQRADGAFRYWGDFEWSSPWLTAYAGLFLIDARDRGIVVDARVLARAADYLTSSLRTPLDTGMNRFQRRAYRLALGDRVATVDYLRRASRPDAAAEAALLRLASRMTWEDRLRLAEVLASRSDTRSAAAELVDAAWRAVTPAGRRVDLPDSAHAERAFPSRVAPAARLLNASLALRPRQPLLGGLIETVLQEGKAEGRWAWSTQDYAAVVSALAALASDDRTPRELRAQVGTRTVLARKVGESDSAVAIPLTGLLERGIPGRARLRLHLTTPRSESPLYYSISVEEVPAAAPLTPDVQGIVVERWYERFADGRPVTSVEEGELVRVRLRVTVPAAREFVAVEDPLPAGLEPVDLSLRTSSTVEPFVTDESERARAAGDRDRDGPRWQAWLYGRWDGGWWSPWEHKALYDDRVVYFARMLWAGSYTASYVARATTSGTFVRPPAHAEEMYNPGVQGRSDGGRFGVQQRRK